jgi:hypothetical protein
MARTMLQKEPDTACKMYLLFSGQTNEKGNENFISYVASHHLLLPGKYLSDISPTYKFYVPILLNKRFTSTNLPFPSPIPPCRLHLMFKKKSGRILNF